MRADIVASVENPNSLMRNSKIHIKKWHENNMETEQSEMEGGTGLVKAE